MRTKVIDSHCHTFNAMDLPMEGFLTNVILMKWPDILVEIQRPMLKALIATIEAYGDRTNDERERIKELLEFSVTNNSILKSMLVDRVDTLFQDESSREEFKKTVTKVLQNLDESDLEEDRNFIKRLRQEPEVFHEPTPGMQEIQPLAERLIAKDLRSVIRKLSNFGALVVGAFQMVEILVKYRYEITQRHINTYLSRATTSRFLSPLIIDFDKWVCDEPKTKLPEQIELMVLNNQLQKGRLLPFVPYDPWREINKHNEAFDPFKLVTDAIENKGFAGVKLYNPMGYRAFKNADLANSDFDVNAALPKGFGQKLDDALRLLYDYCEAHSVPITTHCSDTMTTSLKHKKRAHPCWWKEVLNIWPNLRINLGHFGNVIWEEQICDLIHPNNNIYTDISYGEFVLQEETLGTHIERIKARITKNDLLKSRMMFGTDWMMLVLEQDEDEYLGKFEEAYGKIVNHNEEDMHKFFYQNAVDFFRLEDPEVKKRLKKYVKIT